jgi:hypothetical protein
VCTPVPAGLVSWWRWGGSPIDNWSSNNADLFGSPQFSLGEVGHSLLLDGVGQYAKVGASNSLNVGIAGGFTIDMWINPADTTVEHPLAECSACTPFQTHFWHSVMGSSGGGLGNLYANILSPKGASYCVFSAPGLVRTFGSTPP